MNTIFSRFGPNDSLNWTDEDINLAIKNKEYNKKINDDTMLMHAVKINDIDLVNKLLEFGADTSIGDYSNRTPLWLCTIYNRSKIAELLIKGGASMEEIPGSNSPLYNAIKHDNNEVAKTLIRLGADVNILNRDNQTPLHCAVFRSNAEIVKLLLENNANQNIKNNIIPLPGQFFLGEIKSQTPYEMALEKNNIAIIELFKNSNKKTESNKNKNIEKVKNEEVPRIIIRHNIKLGQLEESLYHAINDNNTLKTNRIFMDGYSPNFLVKGKDILYYIYNKSNEDIIKFLKIFSKYGFNKKLHKINNYKSIEALIEEYIDDNEEHIIVTELERIYKSIMRNDLELFSMLKIPTDYCIYNIDIPALCLRCKSKDIVEYIINNNIRFSKKYKMLETSDKILLIFLSKINHKKIETAELNKKMSVLYIKELANNNQIIIDTPKTNESKNEEINLNSTEQKVKEKYNKKKSKLTIMLLITLLILTIICFNINNRKNEEQIDENKKCIVEFNYNNGSDSKKSEIDCNTVIEEPIIPNWDGYEFNGWYFDDNKYDFSITVKNDITLVARWNKIENKQDENSTNNNSNKQNSTNNSIINNMENSDTFCQKYCSFGNIVKKNKNVTVYTNDYYWHFSEYFGLLDGWGCVGASDEYHFNDFSSCFIQTYTSSNPSVATINEEGKITVNRHGSTELTGCVRIKGGKEICNTGILNVKPRDELCEFNDYSTDFKNTAELKIYRNKTLFELFNLTVYSNCGIPTSEVYTSDNESVASIDENGMITANGIGTTNIQKCFVSTETNKILKCYDMKLNVVHNEKGVDCYGDAYTIGIGNTENNYGGIYTIHYNGTYILYETSNSDIVSIDSNGYITGKSPGTAIITAKQIEKPNYELGSCVWNITVVGDNNE